MKHKLKRIFNRSILSRALIMVITCSIIFSYAVLCPQAEGSYHFVSKGPYSVLDYEQPYDFLGKDIISLLDFVPETYVYYLPISDVYAYSYNSGIGSVFNGYWRFSTFKRLEYISPGNYDFVFDAIIDDRFYSCVGISYSDDGYTDLLYFKDSSGLYHEVYNTGSYKDVIIIFDNTVVPYFDFSYFILSNFYCTDLPASFNSYSYYPLSINFSDYSRDILNISFSFVYPENNSSSYFNPYYFPADQFFVYDDFLNSDTFSVVPYSVLSYSEYVGTDSFTNVDYIYLSYDLVFDLSSFPDFQNLLGFFPLPTFDTSTVGYSEAAAFISPITIESFSSVEQAFINSVNNVSNKLDQTNATLNNIQNTLTNVTPEMQQSIDHLENLMQDETDKIGDVIAGMDQIDTDFGTQIGDFDDILNDNADSLSGMGSTTYNSFINDVFGHWFFVSMFALFGAFAFFSRAVFG